MGDSARVEVVSASTATRPTASRLAGEVVIDTARNNLVAGRRKGGRRQWFGGGDAVRRQLIPVLLLALLIVSIAIPLWIVATAPPDAHGGLHLASLITSFVATSLLVATFVLPSRVRLLTMYLGVERLLRSHRTLALATVALVGAHVVFVLVRSDGAGLALLDLRDAPPRVWAATTATVALVVMVCLAITRRRRRPRYEGWRLAHVLLANVVLLGVALHVIWVSDIGDHGAGQIWLVVLAGVMVAISLHRWVWRPLRAHRNSYVVDEVRAESATAVTVALHAEGHPGVSFRPGQFAWLKIGGSPFVFEEHPFTIASPATEPSRKEFTIKALGDFSEILAGLRPGRTVHLDGPHGSFTIDGLKNTEGFVFLAGGVGVTPMLSMLRTLADRDDDRPALLVVAGRTADDMLHRANIEDLEARLDLRVVEVLEEPPPEWHGEVGWLSEKVLDTALPGYGARWRRDYFICGPGPMVAAAIRILEEWGVSDARIHTELFDVV